MTKPNERPGYAVGGAGGDFRCTGQLRVRTSPLRFFVKSGTRTSVAQSCLAHRMRVKQGGALRADDVDHKTEHDERYATSSQVYDEVHVLQKEIKTARSME